MIIDRFVGFVASVVDINGEGDNYGKVKIRILGDQGENVIADSDLMWAFLLMPITSAAKTGIGTTPNWLVEGSTVAGYFIDGKYRSIPLIIGSINQDTPNGHGITDLTNKSIPRNYNDLETELGVKESRKPTYRNNKIITTAAKETPSIINHIIEIDDTQQAERILVKHKSGAYVEMLPNGSVVIKGVHTIGATADNVKVKAIDITVVADGNIDITSDKAITIQSEKTVEIVSDGGVVISNGGLLADGLIGSLAGATGVFITPDGKSVTVLNGLITNIR